MSKTNIDFPFWVVSMNLSSGNKLLLPLFLQKTIWIDEPSHSFARAFQRGFQKHYLDTGNYLDILKYIAPQKLQQEKIQVLFSKSQKKRTISRFDARF